MPQDPNADSCIATKRATTFASWTHRRASPTRHCPKSILTFTTALLRAGQAYLDNDGHTAISGFADGADFSEGLAAVRKHAGKPVGFINRPGIKFVHHDFFHSPRNSQAGSHAF